MTTATLSSQPSRVELELALRAALLQVSPREHGRQQAQRAEKGLTAALACLASVVALLDLLLLLLGR